MTAIYRRGLLLPIIDEADQTKTKLKPFPDAVVAAFNDGDGDSDGQTQRWRRMISLKRDSQ